MSDREPLRIDFVVAGVQKGGTQALHHFLSQHPEIGLSTSPPLEPHFFDRDQFFQGSPDFAHYHSLYTPESLSRVTGDITPIYTYWKPCIERIRVYNPKMKIIVLLRNPVERAYSQWSMEYSTHNETAPFLKAILKEPFRRGFSQQHRIFSYLDRGFYSGQIERLFENFPRRQCLFIKSEELKLEHEATLTRVLGFLGVGTSPLPEPKTVHEGAYDPMSPFLRHLLRLYYRREIGRLGRLLEMDFGDWLT